jgi:hypothetical protein
MSHFLVCFTIECDISGCVTWTSWGSKLETIFSPVFALMPNIQGFASCTLPATSLEINLSEGLSDKDKRAWSDVISYKIKGALNLRNLYFRIKVV